MELTKRFGLYISSGKENVKRHRLREPDKTKYEIYDVLKAAVPKCKNWNELKKELQNQGITMAFKYKSNTDEVQGVIFQKNGYTFNGSKVDRQFSYSKIDYQLNQNSRTEDLHIRQKHSHAQSQSSVLENVGSALGGLFDIQPSGSNYDPDEAEFQRQQRLKKKKKKRRPHL
jgi:hypothetical protein